MRLALAQVDCLIGDFAGIEQTMLQAAQRALEAGANCIVFPELAAIGYPPRDLLDRAWLVDEQWAMVQRVAEKMPIPALIGCIEPGEPMPGQRILANAVIYCANGRIVARYHKRLLPVYDVFDERRYFEAGAGIRVLEIHRACVWACRFAKTFGHLIPVVGVIARTRSGI